MREIEANVLVHVLVITTNSRVAFAAEFSNQRALINRAIRQVTCERRAYPLSSGHVRSPFALGCGTRVYAPARG